MLSGASGRGWNLAAKMRSGIMLPMRLGNPAEYQLTSLDGVHQLATVLPWRIQFLGTSPA